ncbi:MAG TPA: hypothetical protein VK669_06920 [Candidatus Limnocylindrales bacterium]|nr:hypothetical protein [Candidatus Limnocylindrales bacterium]
MQENNAVALVAILVTIGLPVGGWVVSIVFRHQERMEMLRRGIVPPPTFDKTAYKAWKRSGAPWPPPGAAQQTTWAQQPVPPPQWTPSSDDDPQRALYKGIRVALIGFGITLGIGWAFGGFRGNPIILGGLVPMFVGIAQIIIAVLSGAQLPGVMPQTTFIPPPQPPPGPGAPPPGPGYGSSGAPPPWADQPGRARFEELSKPVPPPDVRQ